MAHNATKAALSTWGGALSDRVGRRRVIVAGWTLYAVTYLAFGLASRPWQIWALFVVYGIYYSLVEGTEKALVAELAPAGARGRAFGWFNAVVGLAALPASLASARSPITAARASPLRRRRGWRRWRAVAALAAAALPARRDVAAGSVTSMPAARRCAA